MRAEPALCRTLPYGRRERIWELDYLRGACIVLMILYHAMYDLRTFALDWQRQSGAFAELYELAALFLRSPFLHLRDFVAPAFFFLAGISTSLTHSAPLRAAKVLVSACLVTLCADLMGMTITMGVLHCLGLCMLLHWLLEKVFRDRRAWLCLALTLCTALFAFRACGLVATGAGRIFAVFPESLAPLFELIGIPLGPAADFYPLSPWLGVFLLGSLFGKSAYEQNRRSLLPRVRRPLFFPVEWLGRHALIVYLVHQPALYAVFTAISALL